MLRTGDTIEYLADVSSPPSQKGIRGQTKIVDRDIDMWTAKFLLRGSQVRLYNPASPLQIEKEETKKGPDNSAEVPGPDTEKSTTTKKERRTEENGQRKIFSRPNQAGDDGLKKPDSKRRGRSRGG